MRMQRPIQFSIALVVFVGSIVFVPADLAAQERPPADESEGVAEQDNGKTNTKEPPAKDEDKKPPEDQPAEASGKSKSGNATKGPSTKPAREQPEKEQPKKEQPKEEQPEKEQPAREQPKEEQPKEEQPYITLEKMVVTPDRRETRLKDTPEIVRIVTAEDIESMNVSSTGEVLQMIAGPTLESGTGSGFPKRSVVSLNGLPPQYVLVLVNGQKLLTEHVHTGQNVEMIPPESIERIEIIQTAASAQYGSDAIGGVINIITKRNNRATKAKVYGVYGSKASVNTGMKMATVLGDRIKATMFADYDRTAGVDILAPAHRLSNMGYYRLSLLNNIDIGLTDWMNIDVHFNFFQNRMDWRDGHAYSRLIMPKADVNIDVAKDWRITGSVEYTSWNSDVSEEKNELFHPRLYATWSAFEGRNRLTFGGDYRFHGFMRTGLDETETQWAYGLFAHDTLIFNDRLSFSLSTRVDHVQDLDPVFSPKGAVLYRPIPELAIRLSVGRGFHAPTVQELYEVGYGHGGTAYRFGNPSLQPETSTAFSLSVEAKLFDCLQLYANGYLYLIDNFIVPKYEGPWLDDPDPDPTGPQKQIWRRTNLLGAWIYGGELSARWYPLSWFRLEGGYSYAGNKDKSEDKQLNFHPGHSIHGKIEFRFRFATHFLFSFFSKMLHRADRSAWSWKPESGAAIDNEEGYITDLTDYTLLDVGAALKYKRYSVFFTATNLLSEDIQRLDDALTITDGEPLFRVGVRGEF